MEERVRVLLAEAMRHLRDRRAFTLVELLVTLAILAVMAVVAVPLYTGFVDEGRRAEARGALAAVLTAQQRYYRDAGDGQYAGDLGLLGVDLTDATVHWGFSLSGADANGFTCRADGNGDYTGVWVQLAYTRGAEPVWTTD